MYIQSGNLIWCICLSYRLKLFFPFSLKDLSTKFITKRKKTECKIFIFQDWQLMKENRVQNFHIPRLTINERNQWHCSKTLLNSFTSRFDHRLQSRRQMQNRSSQFVRVDLFNDHRDPLLQLIEVCWSEAVINSVLHSTPKVVVQRRKVWWMSWPPVRIPSGDNPIIRKHIRKEWMTLRQWRNAEAPHLAER